MVLLRVSYKSLEMFSSKLEYLRSRLGPIGSGNVLQLTKKSLKGTL